MEEFGLAPGKKPAFAFGFLTALVQEEMIPCERILEAQGWVSCPVLERMEQADIRGWSKSVGGREVAAFSMSFAEAGETIACGETMAFLELCNPNVVFLTGIAGSLDKEKVRLGDVVVGTGVHWRQQDKVYEAIDLDGNVVPGPDLYRPRLFELYNNPDNDMKRHLLRFVSEQSDSGSAFATIGEAVFSWDYVLSSERFLKIIRAEFPRAACVEMEAGGYMTGVYKHSKVKLQRQMPAFVVRGISDYAGNKVKDKALRASASENAANTTVKLAEWMVTGNRLAEIRKAMLPAT